MALLVRINLGSPVLFKQRRPGKDGNVFVIYKFRTMTDSRDKNGNLLSDCKFRAESYQVSLAEQNPQLHYSG